MKSLRALGIGLSTGIIAATISGAVIFIYKFMLDRAQTDSNWWVAIAAVSIGIFLGACGFMATFPIIDESAAEKPKNSPKTTSDGEMDLKPAE